MEGMQPSGRRQLSIVMDEADLAEVDRIARERRASLAQVIREFVVAGIKHHNQRQLAETAV